MNSKRKNESYIKFIVPILILAAVQFLVQIFSGQLLFFYKGYKYTGGSIDEFTNAWLTSLASPKMSILMTFLSGIIILIWFLFWYRREIIHSAGRTLRDMCGFSGKLNAKIFPGMILIGVGLGIFSYYVKEFITQIKPDSIVSYSSLVEEIDFSTFSWYTILVIVYFVIVAPIMEELTFRGLSLGFAERKMSFAAANIIQAILFAALQMNLIQGITCLVLGLVAGYIYYITENILVPVLMHLVYNVTLIAMSSAVLVGENVVLFFGIFFIAMVAAYVGVLLVRNSKKSIGDNGVKNEN